MKFWEKIKDFLYDSIDYIIMLIVIIAVVCIISWRLDILFVNNGANSTLTKNIENNNDDTKVVENIDGDKDNKGNNELADDKTNTDSQENTDENSNEETQTDENTDSEEKPADDKKAAEEKPADDKKDAEEKPADDKKDTEEKPAESGGTIEVNIPAKSLPGEIGKILEQQGVVSNAKDFVNKCVELKLDTKLKSGKFTIQKGASLDQIVKIIAKVK